MRRLIALLAIVATTGVYLAAASERATFILTNGERKSGAIAFHGDQHENLINGYLNLAQDGAKDLTFPLEQVAVIDLADGRPSRDEVANLPGGGGHVLLLRTGAPQQGRLVNMINGDTLLWENQGGQRQQFALRDVSRVYLNVDSVRSMLNVSAPATAAPAAPAAPSAPSVQVRVDAKQPWTDTGIVVNQGDRLSFQASGQIAYGPNPGQSSAPEGATERRSNYPDPNVPVGTLLGKIGNSAPFSIGSQTQAMPMPASGRLMLGVNDNELGDNSGFYLVSIAR